MNSKLLYDLYSQHLTENKKTLFEQIANNRTRYVTLVLEDIYQPQNASAILRSAESFGIQDIHIIEDAHAFHHYQRISKGAAKWLSLNYHNGNENNSKACFNSLRKEGYKIAVTHLSDDAIPLENLPLDSPLAFVLGTELTGASDFAVRNSDYKIKIPTVGFTESLNVATAAGIICEQIKTRLTRSKINWQLSEHDKFDLKIQWARHSVYWWEHIEEQHFLK